MGCLPCNNIALMPIPEASHSSSKVFVKSGKARMGASVSSSLGIEKTFSCLSPHKNGTSFFINSLSCEESVEKSGTNLL